MTRLALSVNQPWAHLIIAGVKPVENRTWVTPHRGLLYIHASKRWDRNAIAEIWEWQRVRIDPARLLFGGIIGVVELYDIVTHDASPWFVGPFGWRLRDPRPLPFMPLRGHQNVFGF